MDNIIIEKVNSNSLPCYNTICHKSNDSMDSSNDVIDAPHLSTFIDYLKRKYWSYTFDEKECKILIDYTKVSCVSLTRKKVLPIEYNSFKELDDIISRLSDCWTPGRWFIRFEGRSPKDGRWEFPMISAEDTIEQIITSSRALYALTCEHSNKLYFIEFKDSWQEHHEFRVFICNNKITAISQYYTKHTYYKHYSDIMLKQIVVDILDYYSLNTLTPNCTMDVCYIFETREIELIEIGSFGYTSPTGSALFDWIHDYFKLYGIIIDQIYFRINAGDN